MKVPTNTKDFGMNQTNSSIDNVISAVDVNAIASDKPGPHHEPGIALVNVHYALAVKLPRHSSPHTVFIRRRREPRKKPFG